MPASLDLKNFEIHEAVSERPPYRTPKLPFTSKPSIAPPESASLGAKEGHVHEPPYLLSPISYLLSPNRLPFTLAPSNLPPAIR